MPTRRGHQQRHARLNRVLDGDGPRDQVVVLCFLWLSRFPKTTIAANVVEITVTRPAHASDGRDHRCPISIPLIASQPCKLVEPDITRQPMTVRKVWTIADDIGAHDDELLALSSVDRNTGRPA